MLVVLLNATVFGLAVLVPVIGTALRKTTLAWLLGGIIAAICLGFGVHVPDVQRGALTLSIPWVPQLGLNLSLYFDGLSLLFALLITGIGAVVIVYAGYYFDELDALLRFYSLLLLFAGGMLLLVLSGNLLTMFIGWELTSITSFFLIGFKGKDPEARRGALQALIITAGGGLALLAAILLLGATAGSLELAQILAQGDVLHANPLYPAIVVLLFIGCFSKSAQFPLHFWLPDAMTAPTPASAYLHSATMVKAGIYLLARLYPTLHDSALWQTTLIAFGLTTMAVGAILALRQRDLKGCLAYSTVSQLGALVALLGLPEAEGIKAAMVGILAHALYKAALFLVAGIVDHSTGTRDLDRLGGLYRSLRSPALVAGLAGLSMAGIPPMFGFLAKEKLLDGFVHSPAPVIPLVVVNVRAALTVTVALILVFDVFGGKANGHYHVHAPAAGMVIGPGVLAALGVLVVIDLNGLIAPLIAPVVGKSPDDLKLALFEGFNTPLLLSLTALAVGAGLFVIRRRWLALAQVRLPRGRHVYEAVIGGISWTATQVLRTQGGKLRYYLVFILLSVSMLMGTAGLTHINMRSFSIELTSSADVLKVVLLVLSLGATVASILFKRHLLAALALGVAGYSVGGIFLLEPAPDVALVQFLVETMGTVLIIVMLGKISTRERQDAMNRVWNQTRPGVFRDLAIATSVGIGVGLFSLAAVTNRPERQTITTWHVDNTKPLIGVTDVVAAIVTDFRGMDTVIEITVFGMAALGVLTLLSTPEPGRTWQFSAARLMSQLRQRGLLRPSVVSAAEKESQDPTIKREIEALRGEQPVSRLSTPLTRTVASLMLPFALFISLSHVLYSGDAPGDGFTAGVVSGLGVAAWYVIFGYDEAKRRLRWLHPAPLIGMGVGLAVLNAALPLIFGQPFLVTTKLDVDLPAGIHLASTTLFETGIFLTVLGATSLILETIAHPQEVETL